MDIQESVLNKKLDISDKEVKHYVFVLKYLYENEGFTFYYDQSKLTNESVYDLFLVTIGSELEVSDVEYMRQVGIIEVEAVLDTAGVTSYTIDINKELKKRLSTEIEDRKDVSIPTAKYNF